MQEYKINKIDAKKNKIRFTLNYWQDLYDLIRKHQDELGLTNYTFDWDFNWNDYTYTKNGSSIYQKTLRTYVIPFMGKESWDNFVEELKRYKDYPWGKSSTDRENYLKTFYLHLKPDANFQFESEEKLIEEYEEYKREEEERLAKKRVNKKLKNAYIYAIISENDEKWYVGQTQRELKERLSEHIEQAISSCGSSSQDRHLYKAMREGYYRFEILYESHNKITGTELDKKEEEFITKLQPKYNYEGVVVPYVPQHSKKH